MDAVSSSSPPWTWIFEHLVSQKEVGTPILRGIQCLFLKEFCFCKHVFPANGLGLHVLWCGHEHCYICIKNLQPRLCLEIWLAFEFFIWENTSIVLITAFSLKKCCLWHYLERSL